MSIHEQDSCVSEVSSTISRLRLQSPQNEVSNESSHNPPVLEPSESSTVDCVLGPYTIPVVPESPSRLLSQQLRIPIVGYEVMEERARFTVYKIRIENKPYGDCWFVFRRYTDFVRLHSKLKREFPKVNLILPAKRWLKNNYDASFLEERIKGLQSFIDAILEHHEMYSASGVREFFCLDEPPSYADTIEESRPIFNALEETIYHLRRQLRDKEWEIQQLEAQNKHHDEIKNELSTLISSQRLCAQCGNEINAIVNK